MNQTDLTSHLVLDSRGLESLEQTARIDPTDVAKTVVRQFDAISVNMMLKQMCDASPRNESLDSSSNKMYMSTFDQQLSQTMASRGMGVTDQPLKWMLHQANRVNLDVGGEVNTALSNVTATDTVLPGAAGVTSDATKAIACPSFSSMAAAVASGTEGDDSGISTMPRPGLEERVRRALVALRKQTGVQTRGPSAPPEADLSVMAPELRGEHMSSFYNRLISHASRTTQEIGIPTNFMIGHTALESGQGRREVKAKDGTNMYDLFGIKAGDSWAGKIAVVTTTEHTGGVAHKVREKFRIHSSCVEAFKDYANLLTNNPHYSNVVAAGGGGDATSFTRGLQRANYATDPNYAHKVMAVLKRIA